MKEIDNKLYKDKLNKVESKLRTQGFAFNMRSNPLEEGLKQKLTRLKSINVAEDAFTNSL